MFSINFLVGFLNIEKIIKVGANMFTKKLLSAAVISATALLIGCADECSEKGYQTFDGSCNNVWNADWGKAGNYYEPGPEGTEYAIDGISPKQKINERFISNELMANNDGVTKVSDLSLIHI